jgi:hypothetical protein
MFATFGSLRYLSIGFPPGFLAVTLPEVRDSSAAWDFFQLFFHSLFQMGHLPYRLTLVWCGRYIKNRRVRLQGHSKSRCLWAKCGAMCRSNCADDLCFEPPATLSKAATRVKIKLGLGF